MRWAAPRSSVIELDAAMCGNEDGAARRLVHAARLHADEAVLHQVEPADAVRTPERVELGQQISGRKRLAVERDGIAARELDGDIGGLVGRRLRIEGARIDVVRHLLRRILQHLPLRGGMQEIGIDRERRLAALVLGNGDLVLLGEGDERFARAQLPFPPRRNHRDVGLERIIGQLETHLVVALAGRPVRHRVGADLFRDLDLSLGDQRPRDRGAEQVLSLVERVRPEHGEDVVAHELLAQILDEDVLRLDAEKERLGARGREFLALAEIGGEGDDLAAIAGLQPLEDDRGIEPTGIGEHDFLDVAFGHCPSAQPLVTAGSARTSASFLDRGKAARTIGGKRGGASAALLAEFTSLRENGSGGK